MSQQPNGEEEAAGMEAVEQASEELPERGSGGAKTEVVLRRVVQRVLRRRPQGPNLALPALGLVCQAESD
jgi:hypothetical protein